MNTSALYRLVASEAGQLQQTMDGFQREQWEETREQTPTQGIATPIPWRFFPLNIPPAYHEPVILLNHYVK
jgi:hypothetical protein